LALLNRADLIYNLKAHPSGHRWDEKSTKKNEYQIAKKKYPDESRILFVRRPSFSTVVGA